MSQWYLSPIFYLMVVSTINAKLDLFYHQDTLFGHFHQHLKNKLFNWSVKVKAYRVKS